MIPSSQLLLCCAIVLFVYPFALYPMLLALLVRSRKNTTHPLPVAPPPVAMVICALNEQRVIREKIENCLALDYPSGKLRIIVVSDGSTDNTAAIVREYEQRGVQLIERLERRGKVTNLNEVIGTIPEEIVVLSDANVIYAPDSVRNLMGRFADEAIGCVSGRVILKNSTSEIQGSEEDYYSIEWLLQERASILHSMAGADGAMYAFRRRLFRPSPNDTLIEDFILPIQIVRQGYRVVFEPSAIGWEDGPSSIAEEYRRKVRIAAGAAQAVVRGNGLPFGAPLAFWFIFVSHKLLRWLSPLVGLAVLAIALYSWQYVLSQAVLVGFALLALLALVRMVTGRNSRILDAPFYFLFGQTAMLVGLVKGVAGKQSVLWAKANR